MSVRVVGGNLAISGRQQYRVYARYNQDNAQSTFGGPVTSDYASPGDAEDTTITVTLSSSPPLAAGTYYISLFMDIVERLGNQIQPFKGTITATVGPACAFGVSPLTANVPAAGGSGNLSVSTSTGCAWTASSDSSWLTITPAAGSGSLTATYTAAANTSTSPRTGKITIAGQTVTVTQAAVCTYSLTPVSVAVPAAGGSGTLSVTTSSGCPWTAASDSGWLTISTGTAGSGTGTVGYTATGNSSTVARTGKLSVAGQTATFTQAAPVPTISQGGVVNGASFQAGIEAGSWVTIVGSLLAQTNPGRTWRTDEFVGGNLPSSLDGVSVTINGKPAYVYYISPTQLNVLAPNDTALGTVDVTVTTPIGTASGTATLRTYSPAFFVFGPGGGKYLAAVHPDGTYVGPPNLFGAGVSTRMPAPGDRILLYGTGFGPTNPEVPEQKIFQGAAPLVDPSQLSIQIGGAPAKVEYAGITGNGLYQFNVVIPNIFGGDQPVIASIGGFNTQSNLFLTIAGDPQPALTVTPASLPFLFQSGGPQPASQTLTLTSSVRSIPFTATATTASGGNWLSVTSPSAATPATLTVAVNSANLASGTYSGSVRITAADASNSPLVIPVTLAPAQQGLPQQYTISTLAGTGDAGSSGDGGPADQAHLFPWNVTGDASGNVYVVDSDNGRVRKVAAGTHTITTVAGGGTGDDGGPAVGALLKSPRSVAADAAGNLYIAEGSANRVRKVTIATGTISTVAGNGTTGFSGDGGLATTAQLHEPRAVTVDRAGNLYIADNLNGRIRKVAADTGVITTIAGTGKCAAYPGDGGPASTASICAPYNVVVDDAGNLYVDSESYLGAGSRVLKITAVTGTVTTVAGTGEIGYGCAAGGSAATQANLLQVSLTADGSGNIYVSDNWNMCMYRVDAGSGLLRTIAGTGQEGFAGDGGPATSAQLNFPEGLSVSQAGVVYFADSGNYRVRVLTPVP